MAFLDAGSGIAWHNERVPGKFTQFAAAATKQAKRGNTHRVRLFDGRNHVLAVAACGNPDQNIAWPGQCFNLASEDLLIAEVIANRGQRRGVGGQSDGGQRSALGFKTANHFGGDMLRIRRAAAVAAEKDAVALAQAVDQFFTQLLNDVFLLAQGGDCAQVCGKDLRNRQHGVVAPSRMCPRI